MLRKSTLGNMIGMGCQVGTEPGIQILEILITWKPLSLGGVRHNRYGMTTGSVHRYILDFLRKHLKEEEVSKFQTWGPDRDLRSNEI